MRADVGIRAERRRGRKKRDADGAAVEKREDTRKPEAFFGYRKRKRPTRFKRVRRKPPPIRREGQAPPLRAPRKCAAQIINAFRKSPEGVFLFVYAFFFVFIEAA